MLYIFKKKTESNHAKYNLILDRKVVLDKNIQQKIRKVGLKQISHIIIY